VSCDAPKKLVWLWRQSAWPEGKMSTATLNFDETSPGNTVVTLVQTNVPSSDVHGNSNMKEVVADGWKRNIFDRIKMVFGFGAPSFS
jgi:activator of HSP90 ATPase